MEQAKALQQSTPETISERLHVDVVEMGAVSVEVRPASLVISSPASPTNDSMSTYMTVAIVFIVLGAVGAVFFVATKTDASPFVRRRRARSQLLLEQAPSRRRSGQRRSTINEMQLHPDGTVRGTELIVHEDRGVKQELWSAI